MMQERFVAPGASGKEGSRGIFDIPLDLFQPPMVVVKAPHHSERMINGPVRTRLRNAMGRKHLERPGGQFEPENKTREVIQGHLLPIEMLLRDVLPIQPEVVSIGTQGMAS